MSRKFSRLADLIGQRVDPGVPDRLTYEEVERRSGDRISRAHVNELRNGKKDPFKVKVGTLVALARGLGESPTVVFEAAIGEKHTELRDESLKEILADYASLKQDDKEHLRFMIELLRQEVQKRKPKNHR